MICRKQQQRFSQGGVLGTILCPVHHPRNLIHGECDRVHSQLEEGYKGYQYVCQLKTHKCQMTEVKKCFDFDATLNDR
jgi:hypothetical protein